MAQNGPRRSVLNEKKGTWPEKHQYIVESLENIGASLIVQRYR